jgi:MYXO-CTERM domain-containing protein
MAMTVMVTNLIADPITVLRVTSSDPQFTVDASGVTAPIAGGMHASFTVHFTPAKAADATATISVELQGASTAEAIISAKGTGTAPSNGGGCGCRVGGHDATPTLAALVLALLGALALRRRRTA